MHRSITIKRTLLGLGGLVLVLSACGGGSSALSKDEFLKQGNAICDAGNKTIETAFPDQTSQPDPAAIKKFLDETLIPNITKQVDQLDGLKPPKELESTVDKLLSDARAALTKMKQQAATDPQAALEDDPFVDVNKQADAIGLSTCADDGSSS